MRNDKEYRTVESFVRKKIEEKTVDINAVREEIEQIEEVIEDEESFFRWLDTLVEREEASAIQGEENS